MAYKVGTYKLNLGLDEEQKMQLDFIQAALGESNYTKTVRTLIEHYYEHFNADSSNIIPPGYTLVRKQDLSDLRVHLETCYLLQKKIKEDKK